MNARNGAMAYVPGFHKAVRLKVVDITHSTDPYEILNDPAVGGEPQSMSRCEPDQWYGIMD